VAAVIGKAGSDIPVDAAGAHIGGFMLMADWSARDLQMQEIKVVWDRPNPRTAQQVSAHGW
jgi:fumarylacetoacetate (FAA) hydrolase